MGRTERQKFYHSKAWSDCRNSYIQEHSLCERCMAHGLIVPAYIIHHKTYLTDENLNDPSIALNHDNLEALCFDCHNKIHFGDSTPRRWQYINGELVVIQDK